MKKTRKNSKHYKWGNNCSGWHLVESKKLSVIEELMPPKTQEKKHFHNFSQQFFKITSGKATFEIDDKIIEIEKGNGIHIPPKTAHRIMNEQDKNLEFIVISEPSTQGYRYDTPIE